MFPHQHVAWTYSQRIRWIENHIPSIYMCLIFRHIVEACIWHGQSKGKCFLPSQGIQRYIFEHAYVWIHFYMSMQLCMVMVMTKVRTCIDSSVVLLTCAIMKYHHEMIQGRSSATYQNLKVTQIALQFWDGTNLFRFDPQTYHTCELATRRPSFHPVA